jgi:hypothetical protein
MRMGGLMLDRRRRADLEGVQSLGRLADEMVFSLGRALRDNAPLPDQDRQTLAHAAELFELLASDETTVPEETGGMMFSASGYLDALHAVEGRAAGHQPEQYAGGLAGVLRGVIQRGTVADEERPVLESLREMFAEVGEATLSRAGDLSVSQESHWPLVRQAI